MTLQERRRVAQQPARAAGNEEHDRNSHGADRNEPPTIPASSCPMNGDIDRNDAHESDGGQDIGAQRPDQQRCGHDEGRSPKE